MRLNAVIDLGFNYNHFLHTHSHIAFLGWLYNIMCIIIEYYFFKSIKTKFNKIFWITQLTIIGMLFSFPFQGYAFWSICFSTLYLFASYWFIIELFKNSISIKSKYIKLLLKSSGIYLFLSSLGPFGLAVVMAKHLNHTFWNHLSIYWFLHFLFNGFFMLVILSVLLQEFQLKLKLSTFKTGLISFLFIGSIFPLYFSFTLEQLPKYESVQILSILGSLLQFIGLIIFLKEIFTFYKILTSFFVKLAYVIFFAAFILKILLQVVSNITPILDFILFSKSTIVIGYIHLVMLGLFTIFILWFLSYKKFVKATKYYQIGVFLIIIGIFLTETLLFSQAFIIYFIKFSIPNYYVFLSIASLLLPIGILILILNQFLKNSEKIVN
jgi:hypothetical protein